MFDAIREALKGANDGSIELTVYKVEALPSNAFSDCQPLKSIYLQDVKSIESFAFHGCNGLETIYAPRVSSISDLAFADCQWLRSVTLGNISAAGFSIFDNVPTDGVDLTLSKDQKVMTKKILMRGNLMNLRSMQILRIINVYNFLENVSYP